MKLSRYFLKTNKDVSKEEKSVSARFLKQAGFIRESTAGRFYFLPIGQRVQQKIMKIIKQEMDKAEYQEIGVPILHPLKLWQETKRTDTVGFELMRVKDRQGTEFVLGGTAEEMFVNLVRQFKFSYRDLAIRLYQFSQKFRDELRVRAGLLRTREFIMKDAYSFHKDEEDFKIEYEKMKKVYTKIFNRLGLETFIVESDNGYIGGEYCHEFIVESEIGESRYFVAENGNYLAHEEVAVFQKEIKNKDERQKPLLEIEAKRGPTIKDGVSFHRLPVWQQIKSVLFVDDRNRFILAIIRADFDVNETKLLHLIKAANLRHATDDEIRKQIGSEPGFISPVGIKERIKKQIKLLIVADDSLRTIANAYAGSNKKNRDLLNINIDRDYQPDIEGDIALAKPGYFAKNGMGKLIEKKGIEVGNIFQLGYYYSNKMKGAVYIDAKGRERPFYMGCYGIGIGRTMAAIVEKYHDSKGIIWPASSAPFQIYLIALDGAKNEADDLYKKMIKKGKEVLYDDRDKSAGEKFADADLIGLPIRIVVSKKTIQEKSCELKKRNESETKLIPLSSILNFLP